MLNSCLQFAKYILIIQYSVLMIGGIKVSMLGTSFENKMKFLTLGLFPILGLANSVNLLTIGNEDLKECIEKQEDNIEENRLKVLSKDLREKTNKIEKFLSLEKNFTGHKKDRWGDIERVLNPECAFAKFQTITNLINKINKIHPDKEKIDSIQNYVFELFDRLISIDKDLQSKTFETLEPEITKMLGTYVGALTEIVKDAESINSQIVSKNREQIKEFYGEATNDINNVLKRIRDEYSIVDGINLNKETNENE